MQDGWRTVSSNGYFELVEEDAATFRSFFDSDRGSRAGVLAAERAAVVPLDLGRARARTTRSLLRSSSWGGLPHPAA